MRGLASDLIVSTRQLLKAPGFTTAAIAVLALGIGLNAAMFSLVYAFVFAGRPFDRPDRLVQLYSSQATQPDSFRAFSYAALDTLASQPDLFRGVLAHNPTIVGVEDGGVSRRVFAALVSRNFFDVLGVPVATGRGFTDEESRPGQNLPVVVAGHSYWQQTGFDPAFVGSTLRINGRPFTVVGVTPRGFTGTMTVLGPELFFPLGVFDTLANDFMGDTARSLQSPNAFNLFLVGRLADEVAMTAATERLAPLAAQLTRAYPVEYRDVRLSIAPLPRFGTSTSPSDEGVLTVLGATMLGLTGAVLLTVCLNLASMLMARGRARRKEFAIRLALGSARVQIVRQLLVEGFMLAAVGGVLGVFAGMSAISWLVAAFRSMLPISIVLDSAVSGPVIAATFAFSALATLWFALGPALRHSGIDVLSDLKRHAGEDVPDAKRRFLPANPLLVGQVALSLALLIAAGLFIRMAHTAVSADFGFRADATVIAEVDGNLAGYSKPQMLDIYARIDERLGSLPGVSSASIGALVPLGLVNIGRSVSRAGINVPPGARPETPEQGRSFGAPWNAVSGTYFDAMGVTLLQGRTFTRAEAYSEGAPGVAVIDEALAKKLWPDGGALGQRVKYEEGDEGASRVHEVDVVGIVSSTRRELFQDDWPGAIYVPFAQGVLGNVHFHVRPSVSNPGLVTTVRREIQATAPGLPLFSAKTFADHVGSSVEYWGLQLVSALFGAFGGMAMVVALVGIYGVMSHAVTRRTREIGIRMAVGAEPATLRRMILGESLWLTLMGLAVGWLLGLGVGRILDSLFVDIVSFDLFTFTVVPIGFLVAAALAGWLPARRATRVDPVSALRAE